MIKLMTLINTWENKGDKYENKCKSIIEPYINVKKWEEKIYNLYK